MNFVFRYGCHLGRRAAEVGERLCCEVSEWGLKSHLTDMPISTLENTIKSPEGFGKMFLTRFFLRTPSSCGCGSEVTCRSTDALNTYADMRLGFDALVKRKPGVYLNM